jgi:tetratricopeptide (TPR) repeat protein
VIVAALAARTFIRNRDWTDDVTLWTATVQTSPHSFKAHRGLAEALYESDSRHADMDRVVAEVGEALAALETLPAEQNDAKTYRMAGDYFLEKGDYERAVSALQRASTIVESRRATAATADIYRLLSAAQQRLHHNDAAIDAANRARALEPFNVIGYQQSAAAYLSAERRDDAAIALMTGMMVTNDRVLRDELVDLYRQGLDPIGCAVVNTRDGAAINPTCDTVRRHVCAATGQAVEIDTRAGRRDQAERLKASAVRQFQCP